MKIPVIVFVSASLGLAIGWAVFSESGSSMSGSMATPGTLKSNEPLYWVAPMDPNYRRDEPGLSPMGMELIPVYEESDAGTVKISPRVEHNLGVRTSRVEERRLVNEIQSVGIVKYDEDRLLHIHPRVEGWVEKLFVKAEGDPVKAGEPLYQLYSPQLVNAQEELVLALSRQSESLIAAASNRLHALQLSDGFIETLKRSRKIQQTVTFYSPADGVVDNLSIREGFYVKPGTTLMSIGTLEEVWVEVEVLARQAGDVTNGLPVTMALDYLPGQFWRGVVDYVYPTLDPMTRTLRLRLRFENQGEFLRPNMFAEVTIHVPTQDALLTVPRSAVIRTANGDRVVRVMGEGIYASTPVNLGALSGDYFVVREGLEAGQSIVTSAQFLIDSESSKSSSLSKMTMSKDAPASALVEGTINSVDFSSRILNISRGAIEKWGRPPATMDFEADRLLSLSGIEAGDKVEFEFEIRDGRFVVTKVFKLPGSDA